ncbi:HD domain-containing protein [Vibrio sp. JPW-9-11-11]|uniref:HD-GYP domain-containing protein n=1 Tax=Vibrio sp. JPW-9-11-11 TaxID=1416532 RepID=UPI0015933FD4|nr:HD domain-containing phosphohydrolase [Vibrio sp. JPW-9-11-11]NVD07966.1 HD domain-containing protein [Vibrio sp. JPW-9-11-11]
MFDYGFLNQIASQESGLISKLDAIHEHAAARSTSLSRFSIALIEQNRVSNYYVKDRFVASGCFDYDEHPLADNSSLSSIAYTAHVRIIDDITEMQQTDRVKELLRHGHVSSYTYPIGYQGKTIGFIFINASEPGYFSHSFVERDFAFVCQVISGLFVQLFEGQRHFQSSLNIALKMGHARDPETKEHLIRMGMYSELIARILSAKYPHITHQFIHRIRLYAPLHDIGKYMIPDEILYSTKRFTPQERHIMNNHTVYGEQIIDEVIEVAQAKMVSDQEVTFIKNIIRHHHELYNGKGLPDGLSDEGIPLEARIVTMADVFDALLSRRAYKPAWELSKVLDYIKQHKSEMFDPICVDALLDNIDKFMHIRERYLDKTDTKEVVAS